MILMLINPTFSIEEVYNTLQWFSRISYYRVNETKSFILSLNLDAISRAILQAQCPFAWTESNISYLSIQLTKSVNRLFKANYIPFLAKMQ